MAELISFDAFEWDEANLKHATRHGISCADIEFAATHGLDVYAAYARRGEWRYSSIGRTADGTLIDIAFTIRNESFRAVTSHKVSKGRKKRHESI